MNDIRSLLGGESDSIRALRLATRAGWWTVLVGVLILAYGWLAGLIILKLQPDCLTTLWGGVDYGEFRHVWIRFLAVFKFVLLLMVMALIWARIWTRSLMRPIKS